MGVLKTKNTENFVEKTLLFRFGNNSIHSIVGNNKDDVNEEFFFAWSSSVVGGKNKQQHHQLLRIFDFHLKWQPPQIHYYPKW